MSEARCKNCGRPYNTCNGRCVDTNGTPHVSPPRVPETNFVLAQNLRETTVWLLTNHFGEPDLQEHITRIRHAIDFLIGIRPEQKFDVQWLVRNDPMCAAIAHLVRAECHAETENRSEYRRVGPLDESGAMIHDPNEGYEPR